MNHLLVAWRKLVAGVSAGPIYRGYQVTLPSDLKAFVEEYSAPPMEEYEIGRYTKIGPKVIEWLEKSHWQGIGLGRHWTTNRRFAEVATTHGNTGGNWPILLTAKYDPAGVDLEHTLTTEWAAKAEDEVTLKPGAEVLVTAVEFPGSYIQSWGNFLDQPVRSRA